MSSATRNRIVPKSRCLRRRNRPVVSLAVSSASRSVDLGSASCSGLLTAGSPSAAEILERYNAITHPDPAAVEDDADQFECAGPGDGHHYDPKHFLEPFEAQDLRDVPDADRPARGAPWV